MHEGDWDSAENLFLQALDLSDSDDRAAGGSQSPIGKEVSRPRLFNKWNKQ